MRQPLPKAASPTNPPTQPGRSRRQGPLPPPTEFAAYEQAYEGTAERIISMAEATQTAELRESRFDQRAEFTIAILGQFFLYGLVGAAVYLAINDKPLEAFFTGLAPITVTIYANTRRKREDSDQNS